MVLMVVHLVPIAAQVRMQRAKRVLQPSEASGAGERSERSYVGVHGLEVTDDFDVLMASQGRFRFRFPSSFGLQMVAR